MFRISGISVPPGQKLKPSPRSRRTGIHARPGLSGEPAFQWEGRASGRGRSPGSGFWAGELQALIWCRSESEKSIHKNSEYHRPPGASGAVRDDTGTADTAFGEGQRGPPDLPGVPRQRGEGRSGRRGVGTGERLRGKPDLPGRRIGAGGLFVQELLQSEPLPAVLRTVWEQADAVRYRKWAETAPELLPVISSGRASSPLRNLPGEGRGPRCQPVCPKGDTCVQTIPDQDRRWPPQKQTSGRTASSGNWPWSTAHKVGKEPEQVILEWGLRSQGSTLRPPEVLRENLLSRVSAWPGRITAIGMRDLSMALSPGGGRDLVRFPFWRRQPGGWGTGVCRRLGSGKGHRPRDGGRVCSHGGEPLRCHSPQQHAGSSPWTSMTCSARWDRTESPLPEMHPPNCSPPSACSRRSGFSENGCETGERTEAGLAVPEHPPPPGWQSPPDPERVWPLNGAVCPLPVPRMAPALRDPPERRLRQSMGDSPQGPCSAPPPGLLRSGKLCRRCSLGETPSPCGVPGGLRPGLTGMSRSAGLSQGHMPRENQLPGVERNVSYGLEGRLWGNGHKAAPCSPPVRADGPVCTAGHPEQTAI